MILMIITLKLRMVLQNIWRRIVGNVLIDISSSNTFLNLLCLQNIMIRSVSKVIVFLDVLGNLISSRSGMKISFLLSTFS